MTSGPAEQAVAVPGGVGAGAMPNPVLQSDDHLGRFAPSVARAEYRVVSLT